MSLNFRWLRGFGLVSFAPLFFFFMFLTYHFGFMLCVVYFSTDVNVENEDDDVERWHLDTMGVKITGSEHIDF